MVQRPNKGRTRAAEALEDGARGNLAAYRVNRAVARTLWPGLDWFQVAWIARVASDLRLTVLYGDVVWEGGHPHVSFRGLLCLLNRHPQFDNYQMEPTSERVRRAVGRSQPGQLWTCRLWRKDRSHPAIGYGWAKGEEAQQIGLIQDRAIREAAEAAFGWPLACPQEAIQPVSAHAASPRAPRGGGSHTAKPAEAERMALWHRITVLIAELPTETPHQVCAWYHREYCADVREEELAASTPPGRLSTRSLRRLAASLDDYRGQLLGEE